MQDYEITYRVVTFAGSRTDSVDLDCSGDAIQLFNELIPTLAEPNDRVVLYRIKRGYGARYQDAYRTAIMSPSGVLKVHGASPSDWKNVEDIIAGQKASQKRSIARAQERKIERAANSIAGGTITVLGGGAESYPRWEERRLRILQNIIKGGSQTVQDLKRSGAITVYPTKY